MLSKLIKEVMGSQDSSKSEDIKKLKRLEQLIMSIEKTSTLDPFRNGEDKETVIKLLNKSIKSAEKHDLGENIIILFKSLIDDINTRFDKKSISKDVNNVGIGTDISDLPSNFVDGKHCVKSDVKFSKKMNLLFKKSENGSIILKVSNLPADISKEEFKAALNYLGILITDKKLLKNGDKRLMCRIIYSKKYINLLILDPKVHIESEHPIITQELLMVKRVMKNEKPKLKIASFFNSSKSKLKNILTEKKVRDHLKYRDIFKGGQFLENEFVIDDENNIYHVMIPFKREAK